MAIHEKGFCEMRTKVPIKKAVHRADGAAGIKRRYESYPQAGSESSLKLLVGEVLLFGNKQRKEFWPFFEALLAQFYQIRPQNPPEVRLTRPGWTNGRRIG